MAVELVAWLGDLVCLNWATGCKFSLLIQANNVSYLPLS